MAANKVTIFGASLHQLLLKEGRADVEGHIPIWMDSACSKLKYKGISVAN